MYSDEQLQANLTELGVGQVVSILFSRYKHLVYGVCLKYLGQAAEAEDTTQLIFEKLLDSLPKQQQLQSLKAWLYTVSKNQCLMKIRGDKHNTVLKDDLSGIIVESDDGLHLALEKEENLNKMHAAVQLLEPQQRICVEQFYLQQKSYAQIQAQNGFTFAEVKSYIQNGKRNLKKLMSTNG
jgi:RNA polymerase sigma factor (sigma-70 family)